MVNPIQAVLGIVVVGLIAAGSFVMHWLFGVIGIVLFLLCMIPMFGFVWVMSSGESSQTTKASGRVSKGAKQSRED